MSEREKKALQTIIDAVPKMSDFDKGYLLGKAEEMNRRDEEKEKKEGEGADEQLADF